MPADLLQLLKTSIEVGTLTVELGDPAAQLARFCDQSRVIRQNVANSVQGVPGGRVELCIADEVGRDIEGLASHNGRYIKSRPELSLVSGHD